MKISKSKRTVDPTQIIIFFLKYAYLTDTNIKYF